MNLVLPLLVLLAGIWSIRLPVETPSPKPLYTFPIGIQAYTYRHSMARNVAATLDTIQALGVTEMEGELPTGLTADRYQSMLAQRHIRLVSTGTSYSQLINEPQSVIQQAKALGVSFVMVPVIPHPKGQFTLEIAQNAVIDFNRAGKMLKEAGLTLCYHNHGFEFQPYEQGTLFDYLVQHTDPAYVSFEMDLLWTVHPGQDPVALLHRYGNRFKLMHLKDLRQGVKGNLSGSTELTNDVALGAGQVRLVEVLRAAKKAGIHHYFIEDESPIYSKQVPQSIAYLKSLNE
ncbi:TIM barrel protein [Spirosoma sp. HMF3257]|uniref:Sugar phosphate isomerase/epimerase n=1 Tax=Spirosoma telluris TaxID=2183553 RepID=A0A327NKH1_9BACT|nr:TIM barrel protein [Spirosoma telluris]RAI73038.1 sugar phosphate isomerase/epimerase [Spirosoma telluris]